VQKRHLGHPAKEKEVKEVKEAGEVKEKIENRKWKLAGGDGSIELR